jgi:hypothetical protein
MKAAKFNYEQFEAQQAKVNKENAEFAESLPKKQRKKIDAVAKAMEVLTENGVFAMLFAEIPHKNSDEEQFIQHNNAYKLIMGDDFDASREQRIRISEVNCKLAMSMSFYIMEWGRTHNLPAMPVNEVIDLFFRSHAEAHKRHRTNTFNPDE